MPAHPAGPLACIGHVEPAWIHSFLNPANPNEVVRDPALDAEWGERMQPFRTFVTRLLKGATVGYAMEQFGFLYSELGNNLAPGLTATSAAAGTPPGSSRSSARW